MSREIIFPNLMEPSRLLIMHERNIGSLLGSTRDKNGENDIGETSLQTLVVGLWVVLG